MVGVTGMMAAWYRSSVSLAGRRLSSCQHGLTHRPPSASLTEACRDGRPRADGRGSSSRAGGRGQGGRGRARNPPRLNRGAQGAAVENLKQGGRSGLRTFRRGTGPDDGADSGSRRTRNGHPRDAESSRAPPHANGPLGEWRRHAVMVGTEKVAPTRYSQDPTVDARAMQGDCMLKAFMLDYLFAHESRDRITDKGYLTKRLTEALSNRNMQLHAEKVLPPTMFTFLNRIRCSEHEIGTALEALVYEVRHNEVACRQLAEHLLKWSEQDVLTVNWKGMLLQFGFQAAYDVLSQEGPVHKPVWTIQAQVVLQSGPVDAVGVGNSKKIAEQVAAQNVIAELQNANLSAAEKRRLKKIMKTYIGGPRVVQGFSDDRLGEDTPQRSANASLLSLEPVSYNTYNYSQYVFPDEGVSPQEWFRTRDIGRKMFTAVMNAPYIFPDEIRSVKAWYGAIDAATESSFSQELKSQPQEKGESYDEESASDSVDEEDEEIVVVVRVEDTCGYVRTAGGTGLSTKKALANAGRPSHSLILEMIEDMKERQLKAASMKDEECDNDAGKAAGNDDVTSSV